MSRYPGAAWRPLGTQTEPKMTAHDIICIHTMVGNLTGTDAMFHQNGYSGTESHCGIGGIWDGDAGKGLDGDVWQWQDGDYTADANLDGNPRVFSIETADNAPQLARDIVRWTDRQAESIVAVMTWGCLRWNIPPLLVPDSKPGRRGLAFHRQGIDPWRVDGGEHWSTAYGKECPGPVRIRQFVTEIVPAVRQRVEGTDMLTDPDKAWLKALVQAEVAKVWTTDSLPPPRRQDPAVNPTWRPDSYLRALLDTIDALPDTVPSVPASPVDVGALAEQLAILLPAHDAQAIAQAVVTALGSQLTQ
jgi:hypothetical protein